MKQPILWCALLLGMLTACQSAPSPLLTTLQERETQVAALQATAQAQSAALAEWQMRYKGLEEELKKLKGDSAPPPTSAPSPLSRQAKVSNTGGDGVFVRAEPRPDAKKLGAWPDGTPLKIIGGPQGSGDNTWFQVEDQQGLQGWVKGIYLLTAQQSG